MNGLVSKFANNKMKLIAHRGNINGPNFVEENNPNYIDGAISNGYDVEIDIWYDIFEESFYLGHDEKQYSITLEWLNQRIDFIWIHCKNIDALFYFASSDIRFNYFWHQEDDFTLTSNGYIWTFPGKTFTPKSVVVMPELSDQIEFNDFKILNCFGICSDYVGLF